MDGGIHDIIVHVVTRSDPPLSRLTIEWRNVRVAKPYEHPNGGNFTFQGLDSKNLNEIASAN